MTSFLGAVLLTAASGAVGFAFAAQRKNELLIAEGFLALFRHILLNLPSLKTMDAILEDFHHPALDGAGITERLKNSACSFRFAAATELVSADTQLYEVLKRGTARLGGTDYESQEKQLSITADELEVLCDLRRLAYKNGEKCYRWVGVLCGAAASILLL